MPEFGDGRGNDGAPVGGRGTRGEGESDGFAAAVQRVRRGGLPFGHVRFRPHGIFLDAKAAALPPHSRGARHGGVARCVSVMLDSDRIGSPSTRKRRLCRRTPEVIWSAPHLRRFAVRLRPRVGPPEHSHRKHALDRSSICISSSPAPGWRAFRTTSPNTRGRDAPSEQGHV